MVVYGSAAAAVGDVVDGDRLEQLCDGKSCCTAAQHWYSVAVIPMKYCH